MWDCEWLAYHDITFIAVHWLRVFHAHIDWIRSTFNQITPISFAPCALALAPPPNFRFLAPPMQCTNRQKQSKQQKWPLVYQSSHLCYDCTNRVPKTAKRQSKQQKSPLCVPIVTCLLRVRRIQKVCVRRIHKAYKKYWFSHLPDCIRS